MSGCSNEQSSRPPSATEVANAIPAVKAEPDLPAAPTTAPTTERPLASESGRLDDDDRRAVAVRLTKLFREEGAEVGFQARGTTLFLDNLEGGDCDAKGLRAFLDLPNMRDGVKGAGFTKIRCSPDGPEVPVR